MTGSVSCQDAQCNARRCCGHSGSGGRALQSPQLAGRRADLLVGDAYLQAAGNRCVVRGNIVSCEVRRQDALVRARGRPPARHWAALGSPTAA